MKTIVLLVLLLGGVASSSPAQVSRAFVATPGSEVPPIVESGFLAYQKTGGKAALAAWLKGSPIEGDASTIAPVEGLLGKVEAFYGKFQGAESLQVVGLGTSVKRVFVVAEYERGPLYCSFDCYRAKDNWIIPALDFNTKPKEILPRALIGGAHEKP